MSTHAEKMEMNDDLASSYDATMNHERAHLFLGDEIAAREYNEQSVSAGRLRAVQRFLDAQVVYVEALATPARELLFLYDWRFELAKREKNHANVVGVDSNEAWLAEGDEIKRLLREYGERKKAGWIALRAALAKNPNGGTDEGRALEADGRSANAPGVRAGDARSERQESDGVPGEAVGRPSGEGATVSADAADAVGEASGPVGLGPYARQARDAEDALRRDMERDLLRRADDSDTSPEISTALTVRCASCAEAFIKGQVGWYHPSTNDCTRDRGAVVVDSGHGVGTAE